MSTDDYDMGYYDLPVRVKHMPQIRGIMDWQKSQKSLSR
jgi:hypothetical protein